MSKYLITTGGGLGNEIISYALWLHLCEQGKPPLLFLRRNLLNGIFPNAYTPLQWTNLAAKYICFYNLCSRFQRFIERTFNKRVPICSFLPYEVIDFPEWENYQFLWAEADRKRLQKKLYFPKDLDNRNTSIIQKMEDTQSVSIHVRRGDYQNSPHWRVILGDICEADYYRQALDKIKSIFSHPTYFVFSDDIEWVKQNLSLPEATYIDWNTGSSSFRDLQLMSHCKGNILANSTFSLCATLFSKVPNAIHIAPSKWLNTKEDNLREKYLPQDWIVIDNNRPTFSLVLDCSRNRVIDLNLKKQSFDDFEIVTENSRAQGQIILTLTEETIKCLQDRNFLKSFLLKTYTDEQRK